MSRGYGPAAVRRAHRTRRAVVHERPPATSAGPLGVHPQPPTVARYLTGAASHITLAQCARILTGLLWLGWANWWASQSTAAAAPLIATIQTAAAMAIMAGAVLIRSERGTRRFDAVLLFGTLGMLAMLGMTVATSTGYGTDELVYDQSAAAGLLHGVNPYTTNFTSSLSAFGVYGGGTMTLHGTVVPWIAYPSLSFLLYVPFVALMGPQSYAGLLVDMIAWVGAGAILWRLMNPAVRPWVPILLAVPVLFSSIVGGMTDSLFLPFEIVAVCCWDRFADPNERSVARWIGPVALGLACCMKQPPWLIAPFLLIGVAVEAHRRGQDWRRVGARYVAIAAAVFLIPNIPFIIWNPAAWASRVLLPLTGSLVPMGIGPAGLLRAYNIGGGNLSMFGAASLTAMVAVLLLYVRHYPRLTKAIPLLPLVVLFVSSRNLGTYFGFCVPALAVNAGSIRTSAVQLVRSRMAGLLTAATMVAAIASAGLLAAALSWPAPTRVTVTSSHATASALFASVVVQNTSDQAIVPHFILATGAFYQQGMDVAGGPSTLPPHSTTTLDLTTALGPLTPRAGGEFQVQVGTLAPDTFSSSPVALVAQGP